MAEHLKTRLTAGGRISPHYSEHENGPDGNEGADAIGAQPEDPSSVPTDTSDADHSPFAGMYGKGDEDGHEDQLTGLGPGDAESSDGEPKTDEGQTDGDASDEEQTQDETVIGEEIAVEEPAGKDAGTGPLSFWPGLVAGALVGAAVCLGISRLIGKRKEAMKNKATNLRAVAVQGVGARGDQQDALFMTDASYYEKSGILLCVADGMGGLSNGAAMSRAAISAVEEAFPALAEQDPERLVLSLVKAAHDGVTKAIAPNFRSGGTTLLLGYIRKGEFYYASVGDSRICLMRDDKLLHLNRQHVFEDELIRNFVNGEMSYESAREFQQKGALTSYLGMGPLKYVDFLDCHLTLKKGDRVILMSDGVFNTLSDKEIVAILQRRTDVITGDLAAAIEKKHNPYQDNFSAIVVTVG